MALLDVSELLLDPDFADQFSIIRQTFAITQKGRSVLSEVIENVIGVVQPATPNDLERLPEGAKLHEAINVYYRGSLSSEPQTGSEDGYADIVFWKNRRYMVKNVIEDFSNYGPGWTRAICHLEPTHV